MFNDLSLNFKEKIMIAMDIDIPLYINIFKLKKRFVNKYFTTFNLFFYKCLKKFKNVKIFFGQV